MKKSRKNPNRKTSPGDYSSKTKWKILVANDKFKYMTFPEVIRWYERSVGDLVQRYGRRNEKNWFDPSLPVFVQSEDGQWFYKNLKEAAHSFPELFADFNMTPHRGTKGLYTDSRLNRNMLRFDSWQVHEVLSNPIADKDVGECLEALAYLSYFPTHSENYDEHIISALIDEKLYDVDRGVTEKGKAFLRDAGSDDSDM